MSRSKWKGPVIVKQLQTKIKDKRKKIVIYDRSAVVTNSLIGKSVFIHSGRDLIKTFISRDKVGFKFGEFVYTKRYTRKPPKQQQKNVKGKKK